MIYLITGVPGSGKTLYAVSTLLQKLLAEKVTGKDGGQIARRLCVDGIPDLAIPHELMAPRSEALTWQKGAEAPAPEGHGLWNWYEWCKPGDVIVCDEVQRYWRPRGMGTKAPPDVAMLETHRHFGVDFVLITQHPNLLDQNVRRLVGRHQNVRRIFGGARALIYDWDGCQTDVHRTQGSTKTLWSYPKSAYKLYRSSELHTKQHQKFPLWMAFPLVVLALGAVAGPTAYETMARTMTGKTVKEAPASPAKPLASAVPAQGASAARATLGAPPAGPPASAPVVAAAPAVMVGCIRTATRCECFGASGYRVADVDRQACEEGAHRVGNLVPLMVATRPTAAPVPHIAPESATAGVAAAPRRPSADMGAGEVQVSMGAASAH